MKGTSRKNVHIYSLSRQQQIPALIERDFTWTHRTAWTSLSPFCSRDHHHWKATLTESGPRLPLRGPPEKTIFSPPPLPSFPTKRRKYVQHFIDLNFRRRGVSPSWHSGLGEKTGAGQCSRQTLHHRPHRICVELLQVAWIEWERGGNEETHAAARWCCAASLSTCELRKRKR